MKLGVGVPVFSGHRGGDTIRGTHLRCSDDLLSLVGGRGRLCGGVRDL